MTKLNNSKCDQTQIMTKLKNSKCDKTSLKLWQNLYYDKSQFIRRTTNLKGSFNKNTLTPWQPMQCSLGSVLQFLRCLVWYHDLKIPFNPESYFCQWVRGIIPLYMSKHPLSNVPPIINKTKSFQTFLIKIKIKEIMIVI